MNRVRWTTVGSTLCLAWAALGSDWPGFRGLNADSISPETGLNRNWQEHPPELVWTVHLGDEGYAGPAVAKGRVFLLDHKDDQEVVRAFALESGADLWQFAYEDTSRELYGYGRSTPAISEGRVYTLSRLGRVHCLRTDTGDCLWKRDLVEEFGGERPRWDYSMSPVIDEGRLILCPGGKDAAVVALDKVTGNTLWKGGGSAVPVYATPVVATIHGQRQYVVLTHEELMGLSSKDGRVLWRYPYDAQMGESPVTPLVIGDQVLALGVDAFADALLEIGPDGPIEKWKGRKLDPKFNTPVYYEGHVYGTSNGGRLTCLDPMTGEGQWSQDGFEFGGVVAFEDLLIAANGQRGDVVLVKMEPSKYEELGRMKPLGGQTWSPPVLADGRLLIRNRLNLACVDLRSAGNLPVSAFQGRPGQSTVHQTQAAAAGFPVADRSSGVGH